MTIADLLHLAFGATAGMTLVAMLLFAQQSAISRGLPRTLASLAGAILALLLLLTAAAQLEPVLLNPHVDPKTHALGFPTPDPKDLFLAFLKFVSWTAFLAALVGGVAAGLLAWVTRDDSSEEGGEIELLADEAVEPAV